MPSAATRPEDAGQHLQELRAQHARLCKAQAEAINAQRTARPDSPAAHDAARAIAMADAELIKVCDMIAAAEGIMQVDTAPPQPSASSGQESSREAMQGVEDTASAAGATQLTKR